MIAASGSKQIRRNRVGRNRVGEGGKGAKEMAWGSKFKMMEDGDGGRSLSLRRKEGAKYGDQKKVQYARDTHKVTVSYSLYSLSHSSFFLISSRYIMSKSGSEFHLDDRTPTYFEGESTR